jgi:hypothetical protein
MLILGMGYTASSNPTVPTQDGSLLIQLRTLVEWELLQENQSLR